LAESGQKITDAAAWRHPRAVRAREPVKD